MTAALLLLAVALLTWPAPSWVLARTTEVVPEEDAGAVAKGAPDPFDMASGYDTLALCLRAGLPLATAAQVAAQSSPPDLRRHFARAADLLKLGSDAAIAWDVGDDAPREFRDLAALIRRASRAGSVVADAVSTFAAATRRRAENSALEAAERAGVKISGPLGLCFLPAFVCLGIAPVVIGLASGLLIGV